MGEVRSDPIWEAIRTEAEAETVREPMLASFLHATILKHTRLEDALSFLLAAKLGSPTIPSMSIREVIDEALSRDLNIGDAVRRDIQAFWTGTRPAAAIPNRYCISKDSTRCNPTGWPTGCGCRDGIAWRFISRAAFRKSSRSIFIPPPESARES
jgi:hypothetical protein